jgi:hypothetical protein
MSILNQTIFKPYRFGSFENNTSFEDGFLNQIATDFLINCLQNIVPYIILFG